MNEFIKCSECGKKLLVRNDNGTFRLMFGKRYGEKRPPIDLTIDGDIQMHCIRGNCKNITEINKGDK